MDKKNTAPKFSKSMSETQVLEYIRRLVEKASHDPLEISITFYPGKLPIYQVCPHLHAKGKVSIACFIFCPQNFVSLSQNSWDTFYENIKNSIGECRIRILVNLL